MRDEHLNQLLKELPRQRASEGFTERVVDAAARTSAPVVRIAHRRRMRAAFATAAATLAVAAGSIYMTLEQRERARVEALEVQHRQLQAELAALREQTRFDPVIDLGEEDGVHYILDLRPVEVQPIRTAALKPDFD